jgi:hypothetical protein
MTPPPVPATARIVELVPQTRRIDEHHQLAKNLAQIAAIDFVNDEDVREPLGLVPLRSAAELVEHSVPEVEGALCGRAKSLDKVHQRLCKTSCHERLADTGRSLKHDVLLFSQRLKRAVTLCFCQEESVHRHLLRIRLRRRQPRTHA